MQRFKLILEYEGTPYCGWQKQPGHLTIQECLEKALGRWCGVSDVEVCVSGRTDAGVHAMGQVVHVDLPIDTEPFTIIAATNHFLKEDRVAILEAIPVPSTFHARFSAKKRFYLYKILNRRIQPTFQKNLMWHVYHPLNLSLMQEAAEYLVGYHDFSTFRAAGCQASSPLRTLDGIQLWQEGELIMVRCWAQSFLYHQVRNMVGALKLVGQRKWSPQDLRLALEARDRTKGGPTAPAGGLYFEKVEY